MKRKLIQFFRYCLYSRRRWLIEEMDEISVWLWFKSQERGVLSQHEEDSQYYEAAVLLDKIATKLHDELNEQINK